MDLRTIIAPILATCVCARQSLFDSAGSKRETT